MRFDFLAAFEEDWEPVSRPALIGWLVFYGIFLLHALTDQDRYLIIDYVFLPIHEGGHLQFGWLGQTLGVLGGTILQLLVPLVLSVYFAHERRPTGAAFAAFFYFENYLNMGVYMADARAHALEYVTIGDGESVEHDRFYILSRLGLLERDTLIGGLTRFLGWVGMIATAAWLIKTARSAATHPPEPRPANFS